MGVPSATYEIFQRVSTLPRYDGLVFSQPTLPGTIIFRLEHGRWMTMCPLQAFLICFPLFHGSVLECTFQ